MISIRIKTTIKTLIQQLWTQSTNNSLIFMTTNGERKYEIIVLFNFVYTTAQHGKRTEKLRCKKPGFISIE
jgi:hypothetical protein